MERVIGFEPMVDGFADRRLDPLGYTRTRVWIFDCGFWIGPERKIISAVVRVAQNVGDPKSKIQNGLVHAEGVEPSSTCF